MLIPSVLLIEDDSIDAEDVKRAFRNHKIANPLVHVEDGISALEVLRGKPGIPPLPKPYLVLLDINLPRMNGLEFLRALRQDPTLPRTVVFVLTTLTDPKDRAYAYKEHIAGYILKQNVGPDFMNAIRLLNDYQLLVVLPD
ncbi:response regulator [soil metagenome]